MVKIRVRFKRTEKLRFLSHLDQQRLFGRALRRAGLPLAYSQGYNPHPILSFAVAMPVGMTSEAEYADIGLERFPQNAAQMLTAAMPEGIEITAIQVLPEGAPSLSKSVLGAEYRIACEDLKIADTDAFYNCLDAFVQQSEITILKRNKKGKMVEKNIRPNVERLSASINGGVVFDVRVNAVAGSLLGPENIVDAFLTFAGYYPQDIHMRVHRTRLNLAGA